MKEGLGIWVSPLVFPFWMYLCPDLCLVGHAGLLFCCYIWVSSSLTLGLLKFMCRGPDSHLFFCGSTKPPGTFACLGDSGEKDLFDVLLPDVLGLSSSACSLTESLTLYIGFVISHCISSTSGALFQIQNFHVFFNIVIFISKHPELTKIST